MSTIVISVIGLILAAILTVGGIAYVSTDAPLRHGEARIIAGWLNDGVEAAADYRTQNGALPASVDDLAQQGLSSLDKQGVGGATQSENLRDAQWAYSCLGGECQAGAVCIELPASDHLISVAETAKALAPGLTASGACGDASAPINNVIYFRRQL